MKIKLIITTLVFALSCVTTWAQISGEWKGQLNVQSQSLDLYISIQETDSSPVATLSVPSQNLVDFKIDSVRYHPETKSIELIILTLNASYRGTLIHQDSIQGVFTQNDMEFPLSFKKTIVQEINYELYSKRPQTPQPPYDYIIEEVVFQNQQDNITITGTLTRPKNSNKNTPIAILYNGSGQQDRDCTIYNHKPFLVIADYLTSHGIAVLRYDDRGIGGTSPGADLNASTTYDFARDGQAAIDYVTSLGYTSIHIIGHSEGGLIATILGPENPTLSSITLLASPSVSGDTILAEQTYDINMTMGISPEIADFNRRIMYMMYAEIKSNHSIDSQELATRIMHVLDTSEDSKGMSLSDKKGIVDHLTSTSLIPWIKTFISISPRLYLTRTKVPVLAIYGSKDTQVPLLVNEQVMRDVLSFSKKNEVKVFQNLNHLFQKSETGSPSEYSMIEETFDVQVLETMRMWIQKN